jgi:hypothetical protein
MTTRARVLGVELTDDEGLLLPVRHLRILYSLPETPTDLYRQGLDEIVLEGHEYLTSFATLGRWRTPEFRRFLKRMAPARQYFRE